MSRKIAAVVLTIIVALSVGCIQNTSQYKDGEKENKQPEEEKYENGLPEEVDHFPLNEITVEFINSSYAVASGETSGTFHTGQKADIMLSGIDFNRTGGPLCSITLLE